MDIKQSPLMQRPDYLVCTCMGVMHSDIVAAIEAGNTTYKALQDTLMVGTGCSSCVQEVHEILKEELAQN
jgi:bacterioferritin-associated ferredoxin